MSKFSLDVPLLCLITDPGVPDLVRVVEMALSAGIHMLQLRGHQLSAAQLYALALELRPLCRHYGAAFIVNDRIDVGLAVGADGFQLGRRSLPVAVVRQLVGQEYLIGVSIHSLEEAQAAVASGADFLLAGTIFPSQSHPGGPVSGVGLLRDIKQMCLFCPLLAVGGITLANAGQAMQAGADGVAVISAILGATNVPRVVGELRSAIGFSVFVGEEDRRPHSPPDCVQQGESSIVELHQRRPQGSPCLSLPPPPLLGTDGRFLLKDGEPLST